MGRMGRQDPGAAPPGQPEAVKAKDTREGPEGSRAACQGRVPLCNQPLVAVSWAFPARCPALRCCLLRSSELSRQQCCPTGPTAEPPPYLPPAPEPSATSDIRGKLIDPRASFWCSHLG